MLIKYKRLSTALALVSLFVLNAYPAEQQPLTGGDYIGVKYPESYCTGETWCAICTIYGCGCCGGLAVAAVVATSIIYALDIPALINQSNYQPTCESPLISAVDYDFEDQNDSCPQGFHSLGTLRLFNEGDCRYYNITSGYEHSNFTQLMLNNNETLNAKYIILDALCLNFDDANLCMKTWNAKLLNTSSADIEYIASQLKRYAKKDSLKILPHQHRSKLLITSFVKRYLSDI
ncbi:MAG: hypothetical protein ACR2PX_01980 [Endozoicomonas sp.]|uniref:hypothetical protein n=1 Tax=Endozoicomonas sp. TaxID=1892382 RepID=UPI003D9B4279